MDPANPQNVGVEAMDTQEIPPPDVEELASGTAMKTDELLEDEIRSNAEFSFKIENFSKVRTSLLSPPCYIRNLPWKIMAMPKFNEDGNQKELKSLGFFLQCNGESDSTSWSCIATAELRLLSTTPGKEPFARKIYHKFDRTENDWGYSHFMNIADIINPANGYINADDSITLEVHVHAEAPRGVSWDSKKITGFVGLKNQGATCYMNSLLQTLYFTNQLRKAVYKMPTEADDDSRSVALALQRVFHELQFSDKPVGTKKLTKSFGWEALDSFMQHDVQEFLRVLLDKLEVKMKSTSIEGTIPKLFEGKMISYIKCKNIDYKSTRTETFYDIQLNIKGWTNIYESFKDYIAPEILDGDNKYDAGENGLQKAEKGIIFQSFPPVLHLHLMRFQYDPITDNSVKFNDRFEFYDRINLDAYLDNKESTPADYILHAILVHSGDNHGGHYVVFINNDNKWCKFDDDVVSRCTKSEAIEQNYGGQDDDIRHCSNAYMLVYVRQSALNEILQDVTEDDIPCELAERLTEEKRLEAIRRRERTEANLYTTINIFLEEYFEQHQSTDIVDIDRVSRMLRVKKNLTLANFIPIISEVFRINPTCFRIWPILKKNPSDLMRLTYLDVEENTNRTLNTLENFKNSWAFYLEIAMSDAPMRTLPTFNSKTDLLLFFKFYDAEMKRLNYCGSGYYKSTTKLSNLISSFNKMADYAENQELQLYEETGHNMIKKLNDLDVTLDEIFNLNGDIIIFEKKMVDRMNEDSSSTSSEEEEDACNSITNLELRTCEDYFRDLLYRIDVTFVDKTNANDSGFTLGLSSETSYDTMAKAVGQRIQANPYEIQFFKCQNYKDFPGNPLQCNFPGKLKDLISLNKPNSVRKFFYQKLTININELESKKQFKCLWLSPNLKEEKEIILYPNKNGTVKTLLEEAGKVVKFSDGNVSKRLRITILSGHRLLPGPSDDTPLDNLDPIQDGLSFTKSFRIEEVPADEMNLNDNEMLICVSHFYRDIYNIYGIPFYVRIKNNESFDGVKERIKKKLNVSDKEWEKYKLAIVKNGIIDYIEDEPQQVDLSVFTEPLQGTRTYLGLEHVNKNTKRSKFNYSEKSIKIYN